MATVRGGKRLEVALAKIAANLRKAGTLQVGFLEDATYPDGTSVAMVAAIQDGGAPRRGIPPRPFFRNMIREKSPGWPKALVIQLKLSDYDASAALTVMGLGIKEQLQQSIKDTNAPPLKERTIIAKGGKAGMKYNPQDPATFAAKPLIHTSFMLNSVDFKVKL